MSETYYVRLFDASGNAITGDNGSTWFAISAGAFGFTQPIDLSTGQPSGATRFAPLSFSLGPDTLDGKLLVDLAGGTSIKEIEVAGLAPGPNGTTIPVDEYAFVGATATTMSVSNGTDALSFSYTGYEADHVQGGIVTVGGTLGGSPILGGPTAQTAFGGTAQNLSYYIHLTSSTLGTLTDDSGSAWIKITDPSLDLSGLSSGKVGTLAVSLDSSGALENLQTALLDHSSLSVEVASYNASGQLVDDYGFGHALAAAAAVDASAGAPQTYSFDSIFVSDEHIAYNPQGVRTGIGTFSGPNGGAPTTAPTSQPSPSGPAGATAPTAYYVRLFDASGNAITGDNGSTWFAISAGAFGFTQPIDLSTGQPSGATRFAPLSFSLGPDTLDGKLLVDLAGGTSIKEIEVAGLAPGPNGTTIPVDEYAFVGATATTMSVSNGTDALSFSYTGYEADHVQGGIVTVGGTLGGSPILGGPTAQTAFGGTAQNLSYYIHLTSSTLGTLTDDSGSAWIKITDPSLDLSGLSSGKVGTLAVSLDSSRALENLQTALLDHSSLSVEVASYNASGQLVDDYGFGHALAATAAVDASAGAPQTYSFDSIFVSDEHIAYNPQGVRTGIGTFSGPNGGAPTTAPTSQPPPSSPAGATAPTAYYVRLFDASGNAITGDNGSTWFAISAGAFGFTQPIDLSTGQPSGATRFAPLSFSLGPDTLDGKLLVDLAGGTSIKEIEVAGLAPGPNGTTIPVDEYAFVGATATTMSVSNGTDALSFSYTGYEADHVQGGIVTVGGTLGGSPILGGPTAQTAFGGTAQNLSYYIHLTSSTLGTLTDDSGSAWIKITDPSLDLSGLSSGKVGTLAVSLDSSGALENLQTALLDHSSLSVEVASYNASGQLVDDYGFAHALAAAAAVDASAGAPQTYSFDSIFVSDEHIAYNPQGVRTGIGTFSGPNGGAPTTAPTSQPSPCYCRGTLILTNDGEVAVEDLSIGDRIVTVSGEARPIKWIGRRSYGGRFILGQKDVLPVCFKAGALDRNVPRRDLWISPHHAMYFKDKHLESVLIEAKDLVNGVSIVQAERVEKVEYFHIELDTHDVIIAEGALSESFIDDGSRGLFHNTHEYGALYPDAPCVPARYCAPRLDDGYEVEAARRCIDSRAGLRPATEAQPNLLRGDVDMVSRRRIAGWAQNVAHPEAPVCLDIFAGGRLIGQVLANHHRDDLARAGLGSGHHGFDFTPPAGLAFAPGSVEVRRSLDGVALGKSPDAARGRTLSA